MSKFDINKADRIGAGFMKVLDDMIDDCGRLAEKSRKLKEDAEDVLGFNLADVDQQNTGGCSICTYVGPLNEHGMCPDCASDIQTDQTQANG